CLQSKNSPLTF
nr:immunoglobulin light chain junction region [Macaca mulatta]